jgi:hypothetical protein
MISLNEATLATKLPSENDKDADGYQQDARDTTSYNEGGHQEFIIVILVYCLFTVLQGKHNKHASY